MIKHNSASSVISPFNPIVTLNPKMRKRVNKEFIQPILELFFSDKGGIEQFEELDVDKLKTEIEFRDELNFVKTYLYKELMNNVIKDIEGNVIYKQKYLISFDEDLTEYKQSEKKYPHSQKNIRYGVMRLGEIPVLYYIYIDLQELIRYIKTLPQEIEINEPEKITETSENKRNKLIDELVAKQYSVFINASKEEKEASRRELARLVSLSKVELQGEKGSLRINLSWNTTDDLDLHITTEDGKKIDYQNKVLEYNGSIGKLDIDANAGSPLISNPQENINWDVIPKGKHTVSVNLYNDREKRGRVPFTVFVENGDESRIYNSFVENIDSNKTKQIVEFELVDGLIRFKDFID